MKTSFRTSFRPPSTWSSSSSSSRSRCIEVLLNNLQKNLKNNKWIRNAGVKNPLLKIVVRLVSLLLTQSSIFGPIRATHIHHPRWVHFRTEWGPRRVGRRVPASPSCHTTRRSRIKIFMDPLTRMDFMCHFNGRPPPLPSISQPSQIGAFGPLTGATNVRLSFHSFSSH